VGCPCLCGDGFALHALWIIAALRVTRSRRFERHVPFSPSAGIAGYVRHLAIVAQWSASSRLEGGMLSLYFRPKIAKGVLATALIVVLAVCTFREVAPFAITAEQKCVVRAGTWLRRGNIGIDWCSAHTSGSGRRPLRSFRFERASSDNPLNVDQAPPGTILFWIPTTLTGSSTGRRSRNSRMPPVSVNSAPGLPGLCHICFREGCAVR